MAFDPVTDAVVTLADAESFTLPDPVTPLVTESQEQRLATLFYMVNLLATFAKGLEFYSIAGITGTGVDEIAGFRVYRQTGEPATPKLGDIWVSADDVRVFNGATFVTDIYAIEVIVDSLKARLSALEGAGFLNATSLLDAAKVSGVLDPATIPPSVKSVPVVAVDANDDPCGVDLLKTSLQAQIGPGSPVVVEDGRTLYYKGSGDKTDEANYVVGADATPLISQITGLQSALDAKQSTLDAPDDVPGLTDALAAKLNASGGDASALVLVTAGAITSRPLADRFANFANILDFGGNGDGVFDNAAARDAARTWLTARGGGVLYLPQGDFGFSTGTVINDAVIKLVGAGPGVTKIKALSAMTTLLKFTTSAAPNARQPSGGVTDIDIDGNGLAQECLRTESVNYGEYARLRIFGHTVQGFIGTCTSTGPSSQHNVLDTIECLSAGSAHGFRFDGDATAIANFSLNHLRNLYALILNGDGFYFGFSDGCAGDHLRVYRSPGGTGRGVVFAGDDTGNNLHARHHFISHVQAGPAGVYALGSVSGNPSGPNAVMLNAGNGSVKPVIGTGARLAWEWVNEIGERGAFTPVLYGSSVAGTQTTEYSFGDWERNGGKGFFDVRVKLTAKDPATSGNLRISGIPSFLIADNSVSPNMRFGAGVGPNKFDLTPGYTMVEWMIQPGQNVIQLMQSGDNVPTIPLTAANLLDDTELIISGHFTAL